MTAPSDRFHPPGRFMPFPFAVAGGIMGIMSTTTQPAKPTRRWCRFSLKTLLLAMTVFTVIVGGIAARMHRARVNRDRVAAIEEAVLEIEKLGGDVTSEYEGLRPQTWLEEQFDDPGDADDPVGVLKFNVDFGLSNMYDVITGDVRLEHLARLKSLRTLSMADLQITDAGLEHLRGMTDLQSLWLLAPNVGDAGLEHLKGLSKLRYLSLFATKVTDTGLEHLTGLTMLEELRLSSTNVSDPGLVHLKALTNLQLLNLDSTKITDAGLEHLAGVQNLQHLSLNGTKVTDAGLEHLNRMTGLKFLDVKNTELSDEGVNKLKQALPNCGIVH